MRNTTAILVLLVLLVLLVVLACSDMRKDALYRNCLDSIKMSDCESAAEAVRECR